MAAKSSIKYFVFFKRTKIIRLLFSQYLYSNDVFGRFINIKSLLINIQANQNILVYIMYFAIFVMKLKQIESNCKI